MHLAFLTTGRMELVGLPCALQRLFPEHTFTSIPRTVGSNDPFDGFTSARLPLNSTKGPSSLDKLVQAMVGDLVPGRKGSPPDYLFVVDDLELANADQPQVVVCEFRKAVQRHIGQLESGNAALASRVREALIAWASFHLAVPMAESWLFTDPAGPANAGAPTAHLPAKRVKGSDPELFETDDADYVADDASTCICWVGLSAAQQRKKRKTHKPEWLKAKPGVRTGAAALASLNWNAALVNDEHSRYLRSLIEDVADALGEDVPEPMRGVAAPLTSRHQLPATPSLRNL